MIYNYPRVHGYAICLKRNYECKGNQIWMRKSFYYIESDTIALGRIFFSDLIN